MKTNGGINVYQHVQTTPSTTWVVAHNLGVNPIADINAYDNGLLTKAFPLSVDQTDLNTTTITWSSPRTGFVTCVGE